MVDDDRTEDAFLYRILHFRTVYIYSHLWIYNHQTEPHENMQGVPSVLQASITLQN